LNKSCQARSGRGSTCWLWLLEDENPALVALFNSPATPNLVSKIDRLNKSQFLEPQNCRKFFVHRRLRKFFLVPLWEFNLITSSRASRLATLCDCTKPLWY